MSILATDNKLISFGTDYSAGSGISIIDHTISIVPSAVGKTYSAGPNIGIYDVSGQPTISSKDWSSDIANASANAYEQAVSQIPEPQDLSYISATVDKNTSGIDYISSVCLTSHKDWTDTIKDASANSYTQSTSYFNNWINGQYTGDITNITNNLTSLSGDLSSYYKKTETSSKEQINDALQYVSAHAVGDVEVNNYVHNNSATIDKVNSAYQANSALYITAHQALDGYATEDWVTSQGYITGVNIPESATWNETSNVVSSNSAQWSEGKTYEGISPIVVNNTQSKISADTWTLSAGDGVSFTDDSANKVTLINCTVTGDEGVNLFVTENSASIIDVNNSYKANSGTFLTAIPSDVATTGDVSNLEQTISDTYYPKSNPSSFATESWVNGQGFLTAHQDISNKLDSSAFSSVSGNFLTTSFSISESAIWNETSNVVQTNSAQWGQGGGSGSVSSKYGTISVDGSNIESTNKALEFNSNGFTSTFGNTHVGNNSPAVFTWDNYSQETSIHVELLNSSPEDATLTYSSNTNVTGEVTTASYNSHILDVQIPNATAIQFTTDKSFDLQSIRVTAPTSFKVSELAWKSELPTYEYDSNHKVSAINGSALVGNEDYLVEQGFAKNLTSPKGTISVLNNNKIEGTNSAMASDVIEGFVSAYNGVSVYPGNSATLTWDRYVQNTMLFVSGTEYQEHTLTYSANTNVTGVITTTTGGQISVEIPSGTTSIVIGNENWSNMNYNFTVSADNYYEIGELAWASALPTFEYDSTNKISAINGSALAGGSDIPISADEAIQYVQTNSAVIDATITNVTSNSGVWGGSALPISAGPGIGLNLDNNVLIISSNGAGGGFYSTSALLYQGSKNDQRTTAWNLTESISSYKMIQCDWIDTNNYFISKQLPIPSGLGNDMTRAAFFDAVFEYGTELWCKAQRFSAQNNTVYAQVDEYCVHTDGTVTNVGNDVQNNRPIMVQIIGVK